MTMDLWYDLAARELPAENDVLAKLDFGDSEEFEEDFAEAKTPETVDFF